MNKVKFFGFHLLKKTIWFNFFCLSVAVIGIKQEKKEVYSSLFFGGASICSVCDVWLVLKCKSFASNFIKVKAKQPQQQQQQKKTLIKLDNRSCFYFEFDSVLSIALHSVVWWKKRSEPEREREKKSCACVLSAEKYIQATIEDLKTAQWNWINFKLKKRSNQIKQNCCHHCAKIH